MSEFNPRLHGLRAIAALGVVVFHWAQFFPIHQQLHANTEIFGLLWHASLFIGFGWMGVPLFFVLSGYLLTARLKDRPLNLNNLKRFWKRRFMRIYPAVWLQILLLAMLFPLVPGLPQFAWSGNTLSNVLLYINLPPNFANPINGVWWTLPVELGFYLLLPCLVWLQRKISWIVILGIAVCIAIAWRWGAINTLESDNFARHQFILDALPGSLAYFCAGFALAYLPCLNGVSSRYVLLVTTCIILYLALLLLAFNLDTYWKGGWLLVVWPVVVAPLVAMIVWLLLDPLGGFQFLAWRPLVWIGDVSFGLYLWHYPVLSVIGEFWPDDWVGGMFSVLGLLICLGVSLLLAHLSYRLVEQRAMGW